MKSENCVRELIFISRKKNEIDMKNSWPSDRIDFFAEISWESPTENQSIFWSTYLNKKKSGDARIIW